MSAAGEHCPLVGTWRLVAWSSPLDGDTPTAGFPEWERAQGQLIYTEQGTMSVQTSTPERSRFGDEAVYGGTPEEKATAYDDFRACCGTYDFTGERVVHHVDQSVVPDDIGSDQTLLVRLDDSILVLTDEPRSRSATWERI